MGRARVRREQEPLNFLTPKQKSETTNPSNFAFIQFRCWQRAIFPGGGPPSIFASVCLYDRVADFA